MGGDHAPDIVVTGAAIARERLPNAYFLLFGDEARLRPLVEAQPLLAGCVEIRHTDVAISNDDKPSAALRNGKQSSMRLAIDAVKSGEASCTVSAGNTGALMAMAMFGLRTLPGIDRPAICSVLPTMNGESCMLDLGANVECSAENLVQFAVMGEVFARTVLGLAKPTIGLMNIGVEELKGNEEVKAAANTIRNSNLPIEFKGFVEGDDISKGTVDVIVTDGFTGNVALKTVEGTSKLISTFIRETFQSSLMAKIGYLFASRSIAKLRLRLDPRRYNGAVFLGLNGIVVKSHGGTDGIGFANAIGVAADMAVHGFIDAMKADFEGLQVNSETAREAAAQ
jgi:glycerol-3-phosphate acyltransferase PlsX